MGGGDGSRRCTFRCGRNIPCRGRRLRRRRSAGTRVATDQTRDGLAGRPTPNSRGGSGCPGPGRNAVWPPSRHTRALTANLPRGPVLQIPIRWQLGMELFTGAVAVVERDDLGRRGPPTGPPGRHLQRGQPPPLARGGARAPDDLEDHPPRLVPARQPGGAAPSFLALPPPRALPQGHGRLQPPGQRLLPPLALGDVVEVGQRLQPAPGFHLVVGGLQAHRQLLRGDPAGRRYRRTQEGQSPSLAVLGAGSPGVVDPLAFLSQVGADGGVAIYPVIGAADALVVDGAGVAGTPLDVGGHPRPTALVGHLVTRPDRQGLTGHQLLAPEVLAVAGQRRAPLPQGGRRGGASQSQGQGANGVVAQWLDGVAVGLAQAQPADLVVTTSPWRRPGSGRLATGTWSRRPPNAVLPSRAPTRPRPACQVRGSRPGVMSNWIGFIGSAPRGTTGAPNTRAFALGEQPCTDQPASRIQP